MQADVNEITINGTVYIPKGTEQSQLVTDTTGLAYCIVRTYSAGVFAGYVKSRNGKEGTIVQSRRLWSWSGAASLSQLAVDGVTKPKECKFSVIVPVIELTEIIEVIPCTPKAFNSIAKVEIWKV